MSETSWRKRAARGVLILALAGGGIWLGPKLRPETLTLKLKVPGPPCADAIEVRLWEGEALARSLKLRISKPQQLLHQLELPRGEYVVEAALECDSAAPDEAPLRQPVIVDRSGALGLDLADRCPCAGADGADPTTRVIR